MPTKTEQADLLQVLFGRNSDSPVAVVAPATPAECFQYAIEAWRLALKYMTPVVYLSDAFLATGAEPWTIPNVDDLPSIAVPNRTETRGLLPVPPRRDDARPPWAVPGTPGLEHRIGGLEKADILGNVSYDPDNHHRMQLLRQAKIAGIAADIPPLDVYGPPEGDLLILGWGSTYGAIRSAVERLQDRGALGRPRPYALPQPVAGEYGRRPPGVQARAHPGGQPRPAADADPGTLPRRRRSATTGSAASRSASPSSRPRRDSRASSEALRSDDEPLMPETAPPTAPADTATTGNGAAEAGDATGAAGPHPEGLRVRPGGPLVPGLRRLLDPRPDPEGDARLRLRRRRTSSSSPASAAPAACRTT